MSGRFDNPKVVDLAGATAELHTHRPVFLKRGRRNPAQRSFPRSALWVLAFYIALACCTALWWRWDVVGLSRLLMGTLLLFLILLAISREVTWVHPLWMVLLPAIVVVAAFFYHPLAPTAVVVALVYVANVAWF